MNPPPITPAIAIALLGGMQQTQLHASEHALECAAGEKREGATPIPDPELQAIRKVYRDQSEGWWRERAQYHREAGQALALGATAIGLVHAMARALEKSKTSSLGTATQRGADLEEVDRLLERVNREVAAAIDFEPPAPIESPIVQADLVSYIDDADPEDFS